MHPIELIKASRVVESHTDDTTVDAAELRNIAQRLASRSDENPDSWVVKNEVGRKVVSSND